MNNYNYQLYRSNVKLGGQLGLDIILSSNDSKDLVVSDFHLAPISSRVPYNRYVDENLLNYSHLENIKKFYNKIEGSFYKSYDNPILTSCEPFIVGDNYDFQRSKIIDLHDNTFEMGLKRIPYSWYNNQFSFFCPVWLSHYTKDQPLVFTFIVKTKKSKSSEQEIARKTLYLKANYTDYHNKFVNYFNNYLEDIKSDNDEINKNVININIQDNTACIRGIDVKNGTYIGYKNILNLVDNLVGQERLLMDADNLIINNFENNNLIACQLINFNFIFDIEELIPHKILDLMWGADITIDVEVGCIEEEEIKTFEIKDFYTNYDYIQCKKTSIDYKNPSQDDINIFDLVKDNRNIDLADKNKITQNIIHWSLKNNNDYIYNLYTGFGGYIINKNNKGEIISNRNLHIYQDSLNIWDKIDSDNTSGYNWIDIIKKENLNGIINYIKNIYQNNCDSYVTNGDEWCKNIKFNNSLPYDINCSALILSEEIYDLYKSKYKEKNYYNTFDVAIADIDDFIIHVISNYSLNNHNVSIVLIIKENDLEKLLFANFLSVLNKQTDIEWIKIWDHNSNPIEPSTIIADWTNWMKSYVEPNIYQISLLKYSKADGPSSIITELNHYKQDNEYENIIRYDGDILPSFVDIPDNNIYFKKKIYSSNNDELNKFVKYNKSGFQKLYKSIGYYPWDIKDNLVSDGRKLNVSEDIDLPYEYNIYNNSSVIILKSKFTYNIYNSTELDTQSVSRKVISEVYNINLGKYLDFIDYIISKYIFWIDWEYGQVKKDDIKYNYTISFTLK